MLALKVIFQEQKVPNRFRPIGGGAFEQWCSLSVRDWTGAASSPINRYFQLAAGTGHSSKPPHAAAAVDRTRTDTVKVKFSHTRYRALGPEYRARCTGSQPTGDVK